MSQPNTPPTTKNFIRLSSINKIWQIFSFKSNNGTEAVSFFLKVALFEANRTSVTDKRVVQLSGNGVNFEQLWSQVEGKSTENGQKEDF